RSTRSSSRRRCLRNKVSTQRGKGAKDFNHAIQSEEFFVQERYASSFARSNFPHPCSSVLICGFVSGYRGESLSALPVPQRCRNCSPCKSSVPLPQCNAVLCAGVGRAWRSVSCLRWVICTTAI